MRSVTLLSETSHTVVSVAILIQRSDGCRVRSMRADQRYNERNGFFNVDAACIELRVKEQRVGPVAMIIPLHVRFAL